MRGSARLACLVAAAVLLLAGAGTISTVAGFHDQRPANVLRESPSASAMTVRGKVQLAKGKPFRRADMDSLANLEIVSANAQARQSGSSALPNRDSHAAAPPKISVRNSDP